MKLFIFKIILYLTVLIAILLASLFFVPNVSLEGSSYYSIVDKHTILNKKEKNRIIFVGGSNLSHSLDSKTLSKELGRPVVNFGLHAGYGLIFIVKDLAQYVQPGDLVVLVPEYSHFYGNAAFGSTDLLQVIFDLCPEKKNLISAKQWIHLTKYMSQYSSTKLYNYVKSLFINSGNKFPIAYRRDSYNAFGDAVGHWESNQTSVVPYKAMKESFNSDIIVFLNQHINKIKKKGANFIMLFPTFQATSYKNCEKQINEVNSQSKKLNCKVLGTPSQFKFSDYLFYDSPYHLKYIGIKKRSKLIVEILKEHFTK